MGLEEEANMPSQEIYAYISLLRLIPHLIPNESYGRCN